MQVSPDEFWNKLCDPRCVRVDRTHCVVGTEFYDTDVAPEDVPGFIEGKINLVLDLLGPVNPRLDAIVFPVAYTAAYLLPAAIVAWILYALGVFDG